jgi:HAD superfamily hydrolase (TIGR01509 family)
MSTYAFAAVLFDLDGVVIDNTPTQHEVWAAFLRSHGANPTSADIRATDGRRGDDVIRQWLGQTLTTEQVAELLRERETMYRQRLLADEVKPIAGVEAFLTALRSAGVPRAMATSAVPENAEIALRRLGLTSYFDAVITAADVRKGKPDPEPYLKAAAAVSVLAERCVVIEDSLPGIRAGKAAGAQCLGLSTSATEEQLRQAGADFVAPDFTKLPVSFWPHLSPNQPAR